MESRKGAEERAEGLRARRPEGPKRGGAGAGPGLPSLGPAAGRTRPRALHSGVTEGGLGRDL